MPGQDAAAPWVLVVCRASQVGPKRGTFLAGDARRAGDDQMLGPAG
ncbi:hypothetical protein [Dactylosporangium sp. NPDC048998]